MPLAGDTIASQLLSGCRPVHTLVAELKKERDEALALVAELKVENSERDRACLGALLLQRVLEHLDPPPD